MTHYAKHLFICTNQKEGDKKCCAQSGGEPFFHYLKTKLAGLGLHGAGLFRVSKSGCLGRCALGPCLVIYPDDIWYRYTSFNDIDEIITTDLLAGQRVSRLLISEFEKRI